MQLANCFVALGGDTLNTVPKYGITPAEAAVLDHIHGRGAVHDVTLVEGAAPAVATLRGLLRARYGSAKDGDGRQLVGSLFGGTLAAFPQTFAEVEIEVSSAPAAADAAVSKALEDMTVAELRARAVATGVDPTGIKKAELLAVLVGATDEPDEPEPAEPAEPAGGLG
jgi:hypothetical protein